MKRIYLDHTATTPLDPVVLDAMRPFFMETFGNASSVHWHGRQAKSALEEARRTIAAAVGADAGEVFFTSGGTESDNYAIVGVARAARKSGKTHVVTSAVEHHAVLESCEALEREGFAVTYLPPDETGMVTVEQVAAAITEQTCLVSIMHANNEVGTVYPIKGMAAIAHGRGALFHTDAVQSVGKIPVRLKELEVDLMTLSAHKIYGPKGIGALVIRRGVDIENLVHGGGQERGRRPGTENVPLAVGFARAIAIAMGCMEDDARRLAALRDALEDRIRREFPAAIINGHPRHRLPNILNVSFDSAKLPLEGEMLVMNMDLHGIALTSGSACTSGSMQPSHVLLAMGRDTRTAKATLRFAFGRGNTKEDVDAVVEALRESLRQMSARAD